MRWNWFHVEELVLLDLTNASWATCLMVTEIDRLHSGQSIFTDCLLISIITQCLLSFGGNGSFP